MDGWFDSEVDRRGSGCIKWDKERAGVIPMWVADMDFRTVPCIVEALRRRIEHGVFGYTLVGDSYYDAVTGWFARRHGWSISRDWILYTSGVVPALSAVIKALTKPGDKVLIQTPVYNCFFSSIRNNGCEMLENRLLYQPVAQDGFTYNIDFEDFESKLRQANLFVLCNPHNPAGRVWTADELRRMGEICLRHGVPVISDEIHCEIVMPDLRYIPMAGISPEFQHNTVTLCSPSKAFNIAGLQIANIIVEREDWRKAIDKALNVNEVCDVNPFGVTALTAAYTAPEAERWLDGLNVRIEQNYRYLRDYFSRELSWMPVAELEGTYLVWCDCSSLEMKSEIIEKELIDKYDVHVNAGSMYGAAGEGFIRINTACPETTLREGLRRISSGLNCMRASMGRLLRQRSRQ